MAWSLDDCYTAQPCITIKVTAFHPYTGSNVPEEYSAAQQIEQASYQGNDDERELNDTMSGVYSVSAGVEP